MIINLAMTKSVHQIFQLLENYIIDGRDHFKKLDSLLALLVLTMLFLMPLLPAFLGQGYEQIKVLFFLSGGSLISAIWIIASFTNPNRFTIKNTALNIGFLAFLSALVLTSVFGIDLTSSLLGNPPYFQGIIVYLYCYLLFLIVSTVPIKMKAFYWVWIFSSLIVTFLAFYQWILLHIFHFDIPTYSGRVVSTFGQPSLFSGYLLFTLPLIISLIKQSSSLEKKLLIFAFIINILGIVSSQSRGALLLAGGLLFFWIWSSFKHRLIKIFMIISLIIVVSMGIFSTVRGDGILNQEIIKPLTGTRVGEEGQERRVYIWIFITDLIQKKPILGYGLDNLKQVFPTALQEMNPKPAFYFTVKDLTVDRAHNYILDLLISGGLLVFFSWMSLLFLLVANAKNKWELMFLVILFIYLQFQIQSIVHLIFFYTIAGLINRSEKNITPL
jgi:O-antigen ligase